MAGEPYAAGKRKEMTSPSRLWRIVVVVLMPMLLLALAASASQRRPKEVVFIRYRIEPTYFATVVREFKASMARRGYQEGRDVRYIDILTRGADESSIPDVVKAVRHHQNSADMFITCGWVSLPAREILKETKVAQLFVPVLHSVALEMLPSVTAPPNTNLSGIYLMYHPEKILRLTRLLLPTSHHYAYLYDSRIPADLVYKKAYEQLNPKERHGLTLHYLDLAKGVDQTMAWLKRDNIDAFGGIVGVFQHRQALAKSGIPVITSYALDIDQDTLHQYMDDDNIVAGLFNPFGYCGGQAAEMTADIFDGKTTIEQTTPRRAKQIAFLNLRNANKLGLPISFDALEAVDIVVK